jgi:hypothetical protein
VLGVGDERPDAVRGCLDVGGGLVELQLRLPS